MTGQRLYTPWRMKYVTSTKKKADECVFCAILADSPDHDRQNYVVFRGQWTFGVMNIYPYTTGHVMVLPHQHVSTLAEVSREAQVEMILIASYFTELLTQLMDPDGFNIGMNLGRSAGAGIDDHLHTHIVPRWHGDSNFMSVIADTRVLPERLDDTYDRIMALFRQNPPTVD